MIEVELRAFIDEAKYNELLLKYKKILKTEKQITNYIDTDIDFRMMKTRDYIQLWSKSGVIHSDARKEKIVMLDRTLNDDLSPMYKVLEENTRIKWYRIRSKAKVEKNMEICIDYSAGYGYIVEVEKQVEEESGVDSAKSELERYFSKIGIWPTEKEIFDEKYLDYSKNWKNYTNDIEENKFLD